eukprot:6396326-Amphidinium_carterae.1
MVCSQTHSGVWRVGGAASWSNSIKSPEKVLTYFEKMTTTVVATAQIQQKKDASFLAVRSRMHEMM